MVERNHQCSDKFKLHVRSKALSDMKHMSRDYAKP